MSVILQRGANTSLQAAVAEHGPRLRVVLEWVGDMPAMPSIEAVAFLLGETGKVRRDTDMLSPAQPTEAGGFALMAEAENAPKGLRRQAFTLQLDKVPDGIERVAFAIYLHAGQSGGLLYLNQLSQLVLRVLGGAADTELAMAEYRPGEGGETAFLLGEVYRRKGEWKVKSLGQGFTAGLSAMAETFGVVVGEAAQASGQMSRADVPIIANAAALKSAAPSTRIDKPLTGFGEVQVILNWGTPLAPGQSGSGEPLPGAVAGPKPKGFLGGLLGGGATAAVKPVDLDLCCLFELSDGYRGVVQALGNNFGGFQTAPYIELMGDERHGAAAMSEIMRINGKKWDEIRRILFFAMIFNGVPNWAKANGRARIMVPDQVPVSVRLDQPTVDQRVCSIALIENEGGRIVIHKRVETFKTPRDLDQQYGWGLRWSAGTKD